MSLSRWRILQTWLARQRKWNFKCVWRGNNRERWPRKLRRSDVSVRRPSFTCYKVVYVLCTPPLFDVYFPVMPLSSCVKSITQREKEREKVKRGEKKSGRRFLSGCLYPWTCILTAKVLAISKYRFNFLLDSHQLLLNSKIKFFVIVLIVIVDAPDNKLLYIKFCYSRFGRNCVFVCVKFWYRFLLL